MGTRGGARVGAGRKPGSITKKRRSPDIDKGILPLEMRLRVARQLWAEATDQETGEIIDMLKAKEAAVFAEPLLPYTSPRLQAIEHSGPNGGPIAIARIERVVVDPKDGTPSEDSED